MHRQQNKRPRRKPEADPYSIPPADPHVDAYSRSHTSFHTSDTYRSTPGSSRMSYPPDREAIPHVRPEDGWPRPEVEHDRYAYPDLYARGERRDYDDISTRGRDGWRAALDAPSYSQERGSWRYDNVEPSWDGYDAPAHGHYQDPWRPRDLREVPREDWAQDSVRTDQRGDRRREWRRTTTNQNSAPRRDKGNNHKFASDSGWESRRSDKYWERDAPSRKQDVNQDKNVYPSTEDRSWEPAPTWKGSSGTSNDQAHQPQQRNRQNQQYSQGRGKRSQHQNKQRREWRPDEGDNLNNWTRRDTGASAGKGKAPQAQQPKRKHGHSRSPSRSRSRSPTDSYRSFHSSRGARSRSRSFSPASKRRRRDSSTARSRTPSDRDPPQPYTRAAGQNSRSPSPAYRSPRSPERRHQSASPSTSSSDRSHSRSPGPTRPHRLPHSQIDPSVPPPEPEPVSPEANIANDRRNGWHPPVDGRVQSSPGNSAVEPDTQIVRPMPKEPISIQMPPPATIPTPKSRSRQPPAGPVKAWASPAESMSSPASTSPNTRNFGPQGPGSHTPSVKRFFPGEDEDMEVSPEDTPRISPAYPPPIPVSHPPPLEQLWHPPNGDQAMWARGPRLPPVALMHPDPRQVPPHLMNHVVYPPHLPPHPPHSVPHLYHPHPPLPPPIPTIPPVPPPPEASRHNLSAVLLPLPEPRRDVHRAPEPTPLTERTSSSRQQSPLHSPAPVNGTSVIIHKKFYKIQNQVGEGTFGQVYKAMNVVNGTFVALKRIRMESERDGFPVTAMREIKLLQSLHHENVVLLHEMMISDGQIYMVFQYMDHDLTGILSQFTFTPANLKSICHQMLTGLSYLHHKGVIHRDIKGSNILINNQGVLKLADFGLARFYHKRRKADYTNRVITLWYRPPELLLGATVYGPEVDMWSAGCIMLELFTKRPTFEGQSEIGQLKIIFDKLGTPTEERWPDVINLPWYELFRPHISDPQPNQLRELFGDCLSPAGLDLAEKLLEYDPSRRISARQAMEEAYFLTEEPRPERPSKLSEVEGEWHELEWKNFKRKERG